MFTFLFSLYTIINDISIDLWRILTEITENIVELLGPVL